MDEVAAHKAKREQLELSRAADSQLLNSQQRLTWSQRFRTHYAGVEARAKEIR
jgi:hypothetical protein